MPYKVKLADRIIPRCEIIHIPAGDAPKDVIVQLPGIDGARTYAHWTGTPAITEGDFVKIQRRGVDGYYDIIGVDGSTADSTLSARLALNKGDLLVATGAGVFSILPVSGNDGYVLTEDDGEATGLKWAAAAGGGWPYPEVHTVSSGADADFAAVESALNDAGVTTGHVVELGEDSSEAEVAIDKAVTVRGVSREFTLSITTDANGLELTAAGARVENLTVDNSTGGATANGVTVNPGAANTAELEDVTGICSAGTNRRGIVTAGLATLRNCTGRAAGGTTNYGLIISANTTTVYGGEFTGATAGLYVVTGATANLYGPRLNGPLIVDGTVSAGSWWYDAVGDVHLAGDANGLWNRIVNYSIDPAEHWRQGADELVWTGWAAYTSHITPNTITRAGSQLQVYDTSSTGRLFYYRSFNNAETNLYVLCHAGLGCHAGLQVDNGVNHDANGAQSFVRWFIEWPAAANNANLAVESRTAGGAITKNTFLSLPPSDMYAIRLRYGIGTRWSNWSAFVYVGVKNLTPGVLAFNFTFLALVSGLNWTPARHGLYGNEGVANRSITWDWFDE